MEILLTTIYTLLFIFLIWKIKFFDCEGLSKKILAAILIVKLLFGIALYLVYTRYYTDRSTADIFKYFDDSKIIFDALLKKPTDYFRILLGIGNDNLYFETNYYHHMNSWHKAFDSTIYNDSHTIIRLNSLIRIFSFGYFQVHTVFMCFLSLIGLTGIYKTFYPFMKNKNKELIFSVFLIPSVLFWCSGALKESIAVFAVGVLIYNYFIILKNGITLRSFLSGAFAFMILIYTKFYILLSIIPPLLALTWVLKSNTKKVGLKYFITTLFCAALIINVKYILPQYNFLEMLSLKQKDFIKVANGGISLYDSTYFIEIPAEKSNIVVPLGNNKYKIKQGNSYYRLNIKSDFKDTTFVENVHDTSTYNLYSSSPRSGSILYIGKLEPDLISLVKNIPQGFINALFRPHLLEAKSAVLLLAAMENFFLVLLIILCILYRDKSNGDLTLFWFCIYFVIIHSIIIGLVSPVMGAIVRYKATALPFLIIALFMIFDTQKFYNFLKKKTKHEL